MSGQRNQQQGNQHTGNWLKTAAAFAGGALAGAALAWFANEQLDSSHQNEAHLSRPNAKADDDEKEDKIDGVVQVCEICFLSFDEIKGGGGQIMATPCGHVFCRVCIMESLRLKPECPNCRQHVDASDLQRLYL